VSAAGRDTPPAAAPPIPCRLGPAPPTFDGASSDRWSWVVRCYCARATSSGVTPKTLCSSRRCRSSSSGDSPLVGSVPGWWAAHQSGYPTSCPPPPSEVGRRAAPRPGTAHPGARDEPPRPTLGLGQRRCPSRAGRRASPGGRRAAGVLGQGARLTCHRTAAATRDRPSTPNEGHGAQRRRSPEVSRRWRVRHPASAGYLKRRSAPVERGR